MGLNIAFFAPYFQHVGTVPLAEVLSDRFRARGHEVQLLRTHREWTDNRFDEGSVVSLTSRATRWVMARDSLPFGVRKLAFGGLMLPKLVAYLRREKPEVIMTALLGAVGIAARELAGVDTRVVSVIHGYPHESPVRRYLWPLVYERADAIVAPVQGVAEATSDLTGIDEADITVVPDPVVTDGMLEQARETSGHEWFDGHVPVVLAVGRQTPQKGFDVLLEAIAKVRERRPVRLVVLGSEGESTPVLREKVHSLRLEDAVDLPGFVDNPYSCMTEADLFVLSSRWEGPGHVLIEAMAVGTTVVTTDCPAGPADIVEGGDAGGLVPVDDPDAMATAIRELLDDDEKRMTLSATGKRAVERFHADTAADQYLRLVESLAGDGDG